MVYASHPTDRNDGCAPSAMGPAACRGTLAAPGLEGGTGLSIQATRQGSDRDAAERKAWEAYRESLRDLEGHEYEAAEDASWERLQRALKDIERANAGV